MTDIKSSITETHDRWHKGHIEPFWTKQSFTNLQYICKPFNNNNDFIKWRKQGYWPDKGHYGGLLCDMNAKQPIWNKDIINWFEITYNVIDVGASYFRMNTCHYLPTHSDTYHLYKQLFNCTTKDIIRIVVFLDDWQSGHISEVDDRPITDWKAGDYICWQGNTPHMAGNMGVKPRYTLQLTGHYA